MSDLRPVSGEEAVYPVSPETVTVLGNRVKETDAMWRGLRWQQNAQVREKASLVVFVCGYNDAPPDHHLRVFWCHPDDKFDPENECYYRVRPKMEPGKKWKGRKVLAVAIEPALENDPPWQIRVQYAGRASVPQPSCVNPGSLPNTDTASDKPEDPERGLRRDG